jgi:hypothetical protein
MADIEPVVRHMLLCDDVRVDPTRPGRRDVLGWYSVLTSTLTPPFPLRFPSMCVYSLLVGGRGKGEARVAVRHADTDAVVQLSQRYRITFPADPLRLVYLKILVQNCTFPRPGLYTVELYWNQSLVAQESLRLR